MGIQVSKKYFALCEPLMLMYDKKSDQYLVLLTNNLFWKADMKSQLYKARWDIAPFFKQIKQVLKIKTFVGTSQNAVLIHILTAMISILLLKYLQNRAKHKWHLSNLVAMLRTPLFSKIEIWRWLDFPFIKPNLPPNQFPLLELS